MRPIRTEPLPHPPSRTPPTSTMLVTDPELAPVYTANQETDARGALTRGLAEYVAGLSRTMPGGRTVAFRYVLPEWAEPETGPDYPSASVTSVEEGKYDASSFTPRILLDARLSPPDARYLVKASEFMLTMKLDIWCTDPAERMALVAAVEGAMCPTDWMYGARLELPHYFNARATYELLSMSYVDTAEDALRRYRRALVTIAGCVPVMRLVSLPTLKPRVEVQVSEGPLSR